MFITLIRPLMKMRLILITFYTARILTVCSFLFLFPVKCRENKYIEALKTCEKMTSIVPQGTLLSRCNPAMLLT